MASSAAPATAEGPTDIGAIRHYHAHVYYDPASSRDRAARLRERVAAAFPEATLGRWHDELVGPHLQSMYQIAFPCDLLASFLPWLMLNRDGLTILLHPGTGNPTPTIWSTPPGSAACCRCAWRFCGILAAVQAVMTEVRQRRSRKMGTGFRKR